MRKGPTPGEDAKNLALIGASALVGIWAVAMMASAPGPRHAHTVRHALAIPDYSMVEPLSGINRIYGTVRTWDGQEATGFLRWDRNEGSWSDLLDADKFKRGSSASASGIRFGHVAQIRPINGNSAHFILRSGEEVTMVSQASDLGSGMRALTVSQPGSADVELGWRDIEQVDFHAAPTSARPANNRLHGTLTTRSGYQFTGYVTWDVDEIYSTDILDGESFGQDYEVPFGAIQRIERVGQRSARVFLHSGEELVLSRSNDVNRRNKGISVSDPFLGQAKVKWSEFDNVTFHGTADEAAVRLFDGGNAIRGTVVTESGDEISGDILWDRDESRTWEMLNGESRGVELHFEFGHVQGLRKIAGGSEVTLRDGRVFPVHGSNDVNVMNRGIQVESSGQTYDLEWDDFSQLRLTH